MLQKTSSPLPPPLPPPYPLRRWLRGSLLGAGSFGRVSLALNLDDGFLFAVKSAPCFPSPQLLALQNELSLLQAMDSPRIIRCFGSDISICENSLCLNLFLEYMQGGSIADLLRRSGGRLDERRARDVTRAVLEGISYLHMQGIVHGDIKGQNILLGACGEVRIADFGAARVAGTAMEACRDFSLRGTPLWMAPEVLRGEEAESSSDIWSLGCTLIEMLQGTPPWGSSKDRTSAGDLAALLVKIAYTQEPAPLMDSLLSADAMDFLSKCLQRDPHQRWTADQLLSHPFVMTQEGRGARDYASQGSPRSILSFDGGSDLESESESEPPAPAMSGLASPGSDQSGACMRFEGEVDKHNDERQQKEKVVLCEQMVMEEAGLTWITVRCAEDDDRDTGREKKKKKKTKPFFRAGEVSVRKGSEISLDCLSFLANRGRTAAVG